MSADSSTEHVAEKKKDVGHYPWPLNVLAKEASVIRSAPWSFATVVLVWAAAIYFGVDRLYKGEIRAKDATIGTLKLRLESLPAQAAEIDRLRTELSTMRETEAKRLAADWPTLTYEQVGTVKMVLGPLKTVAGRGCACRED